MSAALNKELIRTMWAETAKGKFPGFLNGYSDDLRYTTIGTTRFSGTYNGKQELLERVLVPMMTDLETSGGLEADTLIAEGDYVVVQGRGVGRRASPASLTTTPTASPTSWRLARLSKSRSIGTPSW